MKKKIVLGAIAITVIIITIIIISLATDTYSEELSKIATEKNAIQQEINTLAEQRDELRLEKIDVMANWFNKSVKLKAKSKYTEDQRKDLEYFILSKLGMEYKYGAKGGGKIDCSGLLGAYAFYKKKLITHNTFINHYNAELIRQNNVKKNLEDITEGDLLYIIKNGKAVHIMYIYSIDHGNITTLEANVNDGVSFQEYRFIKGNEGIFLEQNGKVYDFDITSNSLISMELIGDFLISSYIPTSVGMNINNGGKSGRHTASGLPLKDEYAGKIVACPKRYSIGSSGEAKQKLYIEDYGIVECSDRGGLIVMKGEINSRGNKSSYNRLDLFAGMDTAKIERGQQHRNVYLIN